MSMGIPLDGVGGGGLGGMGVELAEEGGTSREGSNKAGWSVKEPRLLSEA